MPVKFDWYRFDHNPMLMYSSPAGYVIMKHAQFNYSLHIEDSPDVAPIAVHRDWQALAEIADKLVRQ